MATMLTIMTMMRTTGDYGGGDGAADDHASNGAYADDYDDDDCDEHVW